MRREIQRRHKKPGEKVSVKRFTSYKPDNAVLVKERRLTSSHSKFVPKMSCKGNKAPPKQKGRGFHKKNKYKNSK